MFSSQANIRPGLHCLLRSSRALATRAAPTQTAPVHPTTSFGSPVPVASASQVIAGSAAPKPQLSVRYPYFVRRTKNGNLPVYTDTLGHGYLDAVHIRRIEGDIHKLKDDLLTSLLPPETGKKELERLQKRFIMKNSTTISLIGGRWRIQVLKWLIARGF